MLTSLFWLQEYSIDSQKKITYMYPSQYTIVFILGSNFHFPLFYTLICMHYHTQHKINRGYYMAAWRYEISLRVLKNISWVSTANSWKRNFVSPSTRTREIFFNTQREILYLQEAIKCFIYHINTNEIPNHFTFRFEGTIYYVTIATIIFSCVKITCYFHVWRYNVFARKLTWYFTGVYIIKLNIQLRI